jgi:hypothetical protein
MIIDPHDRSGKLPSDWRDVWSAFTALRKVAREIGEPVGGWSIEAGRRVGRRYWTMTYTFKGRHMNAYIGRTGKEAALTIKETLKGFQSVLEGEKAAQKHSKPVLTPKKINPIYDPGLVDKMKSKWDDAMKSLKDTRSVTEFREKEKYLNWFMKQKAGVLNMSMQDYLYKHPHGTLWPTPPKDKQQYEARQRELEKRIREKERHSYGY